ncbi:MAG: THUMP domain-containing class I SAM-dependent RNA methyltransferase, partial [Candidatus Marinamargulisbacteria bacterium]
NDVFMDPFCGSGTLLIEAPIMAHNIAPRLKHSFCSEHWPLLASAWPKAKKAATQQQTNPPFRIYGSDINADMLKTARFNLKRAGIDGVFVETKDAIQIQSRFDKGKIISNPPYGVRLDDAASVHQLIAKLGPHLRQYFPLWDYYFLSGDPQFQSYFNQKATKKRKLFNGTIQCHLYQYF